MDLVTAPPGWHLLLRAWVTAFGESEGATRSLSAGCSAAAVAVLFLAVRRWAGPEPALWAAALMAVAGPQVHAAHDARPYAVLTLEGTVALWIVGRTVALGPTRRRSAGLAAVLLAMLLTHYFAIAAVAAVGAYGLVAYRGVIRRHLVTSAVVAAVTFAVAWGPFMVRQRPVFSPTDRGVVFLYEPGPGHAAATVWRALTLPASLLADARPIPAWYAGVGVAVYAAAIVATARRRWPVVWPLWYVGVVGLLSALDLTRSTAHLAYLRYPLLVGPVVYAAVGLVPRLGRATAWVVAGRVVAGAAVVMAAASLPAVYRTPNADFRGLGDAMRASIKPGDLIVFAGPSKTFAPQILYLAASHYAGPLAGPVVLLESPATAAAMAEVGDRATVWMVADPEVRLAREWLPGYHLARGQSWPVVGSLLRMDRNRT